MNNKLRMRMKGEFKPQMLEKQYEGKVTKVEMALFDATMYCCKHITDQIKCTGISGISMKREDIF